MRACSCLNCRMHCAPATVQCIQRTCPRALGCLTQVALIAAEREVITLRTQQGEQQQHIQLLESRLLEQGQDVAAMLGRKDHLQTSISLGSRSPSLVRRMLGNTEALMPQEAWDLDPAAAEAAGGAAPSAQLLRRAESAARAPSAEAERHLLAEAASLRLALAAASREVAEKDDIVRALQQQLQQMHTGAAEASQEPAAASSQAQDEVFVQMLRGQLQAADQQKADYEQQIHQLAAQVGGRGLVVHRYASVGCPPGTDSAIRTWSGPQSQPSDALQQPGPGQLGRSRERVRHPAIRQRAVRPQPGTCPCAPTRFIAVRHVCCMPGCHAYRGMTN